MQIFRHFCLYLLVIVGSSQEHKINRKRVDQLYLKFIREAYKNITKRLAETSFDVSSNSKEEHISVGNDEIKTIINPDETNLHLPKHSNNSLNNTYNNKDIVNSLDSEYYYDSNENLTKSDPIPTNNEEKLEPDKKFDFKRKYDKHLYGDYTVDSKGQEIVINSGENHHLEQKSQQEANSDNVLDSDYDEEENSAIHSETNHSEEAKKDDEAKSEKDSNDEDAEDADDTDDGEEEKASSESADDPEAYTDEENQSNPEEEVESQGDDDDHQIPELSTNSLFSAESAEASQQSDEPDTNQSNDQSSEGSQQSNEPNSNKSQDESSEDSQHSSETNQSNDETAEASQYSGELNATQLKKNKPENVKVRLCIMNSVSEYCVGQETGKKNKKKADDLA